MTHGGLFQQTLMTIVPRSCLQPAYLDTPQTQPYISTINECDHIIHMQNLSQTRGKPYRSLLFGLLAAILASGAISGSLLFAQAGSTRSSTDKDFAYAVGLYRDGLYQMAAARFNEFLLRHPDADRAPQALYLFGECSFQQGDWQACRSAMEKFRIHYPFHPLADEAELRLGQSLFQSGSEIDAVGRFDHLINHHTASPLIPDAWYWKGEASLSAGDTATALNCYRTLVEKYTDHAYAPWAAYTTGFIKEDRGDTTAALAAYELIWKRYPDSDPAGRARYRSGHLLYSRGSYAEAAGLLEDALQGDLPPDVRRHTNF
ncbi:MAG TPA: tetratricopeptide repeat protein, partial [Bacteroidetes bacterium]|nr:tetratricopeptide repeat protein [Bacteroidota bacterium]